MVSVVDNIQRFCLWFPSLVCLWFPSSQETLFMVSVVGFYGFRRGRKTFLFMVSVAGFLVDPAAAGGSTISECIERFLFCVFLGLVSVAGFLWFPSWQENVCFMVSVVGLLYGLRRGKECFVLWFPSLLFLWFPAATGPRLSLRWNHKKEQKKTKRTSGRFRDELSIHMYIYIYIHTHIHTRVGSGYYSLDRDLIFRIGHFKARVSSGSCFQGAGLYYYYTILYCTILY